jgi:XTP/dITP diphosphohydrolase
VTKLGRIVVASFNRAKTKEVLEIVEAAGLDAEVLSLADIPNASLPPEKGATFAENAGAKARAAAQLTGYPAVADDSGLQVDALGGEPGVHSARYLGGEASDEERYISLLKRLEEVTDERRGARFHCAAAYADPGGEEMVAEGVCEGRIARQARGEGGFGYDPIFIPEGYSVTMAQLTPQQKHAISHRGRALRALMRMIAEQRSGR